MICTLLDNARVVDLILKQISDKLPELAIFALRLDVILNENCHHQRFGLDL